MDIERIPTCLQEDITDFHQYGVNGFIPDHLVQTLDMWRTALNERVREIGANGIKRVWRNLQKKAKNKPSKRPFKKEEDENKKGGFGPGGGRGGGDGDADGDGRGGATNPIEVD